jgi:hypothetical protein
MYYCCNGGISSLVPTFLQEEEETKHWYDKDEENGDL